MRRVFSVAVIVLIAMASTARAEWVDAEGVTYMLVLPKDYDAAKTYRLVVAVHGRNGQGNMANGEARAFHARGHDVIVAGPNMPWGSGEGKDKSPSGDAALDAMVKDLRAKHKLHEKFALVGFSQGGYFVPGYAATREAQLLMMVYYGSSAPNYVPKELPVGGACGSQEAFGDGIKAWAQKVNDGGGYAVSHIAEGAGHTITDSMRKMTVDLYERCFKGLAPRVMEEVESKFAAAKELSEAGKHREAIGKYKSILATKDLPADLAQRATELRIDAELSRLAERNENVRDQWSQARQTVAEALVEFPGVLEIRKLIDEQRRPFRASELDDFFDQATTASYIVNHVLTHLKTVEAAQERGGTGPNQVLLNRRIVPLLKRVTDSQLLAALERHFKKLPGPVER